MDGRSLQIKVFALMHNRHAWTDRTEDGVKREIRVIKHGGLWRFQSKRGDSERWKYYDEPFLGDLQIFREILFRKYQRRRAAFEDVQWVDRELARRRQKKASPAKITQRPKR